MKRTILITGSSGFLGKHLTHYLSENGYYIIGIDLAMPLVGETQPDEFYHADFSNAIILNKIFTQHKIEIVIHLAASICVPESVENPQLYYENNAIRVFHFLTTLRHLGLKYLIFSSSAAVYGTPSISFIPVDHPLVPINPYGESKKIAETFIKSLAKQYEFNYAILRHFNIAGANDSGSLHECHVPETHIIPVILNNILAKNNRVSVFGNKYQTFDGTAVRDYIHITDICDVHLKILQQFETKKVNYVLNVGSGIGTSMIQLIKATEAVLDIHIDYIIADPRQGDPGTLVADSSLTQQQLDWRPSNSAIEKIILDAWRALEQHYNVEQTHATA